VLIVLLLVEFHSDDSFLKLSRKLAKGFYQRQGWQSVEMTIAKGFRSRGHYSREVLDNAAGFSDFSNSCEVAYPESENSRGRCLAK
jgi:hypothetical protein